MNFCQSRSISRVLFPFTVSLKRNDDHYSGTAVACCLKRHYPRTSSGLLLMFSYLVLLRMGFTKLSRSPGKLVSSYLTFSPLPRETAHKPASQGGMFSVALSLGSPPVAVSDHPALWSSDFPPIREAGPAIIQSTLTINAKGQGLRAKALNAQSLIRVFILNNCVFCADASGK